MKILVTGCSGMLGRNLVSQLNSLSHSENPQLEVIATDHKCLDITHTSNVLGFVSQVRPDTMVNCAAFSHVDACEAQISEAFAVNAVGPRNIALAGKEFGVKIVHISTDYVFDGTKSGPYEETDKPNPLSVYGKSKLEGELAVQEIAGDCAIVRTAWLFGPYRRNFVTAMLDLGEKNPAISVVTDQYGCPTYTADLSAAIWTVIRLGLRGIYHVTNSGTCSRYEWAKKILELKGIRASVLPIKTADYRRAARVPQNSSLDCTKFVQASGQKMRPWQEALEEYLIKLHIP